MRRIMLHLWILALLLDVTSAYGDLLTIGKSHGWTYVPYDARTMHFGVSPEESCVRAQTWLNLGGAQMSLLGITYDRGHTARELLHPEALPAVSHDLMYIFTAGDGRYVLTGIHPWANLIYYNENEDLVPQAGTPQVDVRVRQRNEAEFLETLTPRLDLLPHRTSGDGRVYLTEQGFEHFGRFVHAEANAWSGRVVYCRYTDCGPSLPSGLVLFPAPRATELALQYVASFTGVLDVATPDDQMPRVTVGADPDTLATRLIRGVPVVATQQEGGGNRTSACLFDVVEDALTGEVVDVIVYAGSRPESPKAFSRRTAKRLQWTKPRPLALWVNGKSRETVFPPLLCEGKPYLWVRWACAVTNGSRIHASANVNGASVTISSGNRTYSGKLSHRDLAGAGGILRLSAPLKVISGRLYVPSDCLEPLFGITARYERKANRLEISTSLGNTVIGGKAAGASARRLGRPEAKETKR